MTAMTLDQSIDSIFAQAGEIARKENLFASVQAGPDGVHCAALVAPEPATYSLFLDGESLYVSFSTLDRWLSQSIEADLMFTGDKLEDLIDEEATDFGFDGGPLEIEHFRDESKRYVFRSRIPARELGDEQAITNAAVACLLAYEAVFRELGDMGEDSDD